MESTDWTSGKYGNSLNFDGVNEMISVADDPRFEFAAGESFTMASWYKGTDTWSDEQGIITKGYDTPTQYRPIYALSMGKDGRSYLFTRNSSGSITEGISGPDSTLADGKWHYIVCIRNSDTNELIIYVDGVSRRRDHSDFAVGTNTSNLVFMNTYNRYTPGLLDDVRFYNYALSDDQVLQLFHNKNHAIIFE